MAAFRDDVPLVAGINENWDKDTTRSQIVRPDWDFSPICMKTMHHLPHIFFDTLRPERPRKARLPYTRFLAMPHKPSLIDMMRQDMDDSDEVPPQSPPQSPDSYYRIIV